MADIFENDPGHKLPIKNHPEPATSKPAYHFCGNCGKEQIPAGQTRYGLCCTPKEKTTKTNPSYPQEFLTLDRP